MARHVEKFTMRARAAIEAAQEEARALRHDNLAPEHLLLGLARVQDGYAAMALTNCGVSFEQVRDAVTALREPGHAEVSGSLTRTPELNAVLQQANEEAKQLDHHYLGSEHLLLALMATLEADSVLASVLAATKLDPAQVRAETLQVMTQPNPMAGPAARPSERQPSARRYTLVLPEPLFQEVQALAEREQTTVVELFRRFTKLGLLVTRAQERPDTALILREGNSEQRLVFL